METDPNIVRAFIQNENEMINNRMNWFLILQGFMFAGLAFAWEKNSLICIVFSCVGMLSALSVGVLLRCGILAIKKLDESIEDTVLGKSSKEVSIFIHFILPWHFFPVLMIVAWASIIVIRLFN